MTIIKPPTEEALALSAELCRLNRHRMARRLDEILLRVRQEMQVAARNRQDAAAFLMGERNKAVEANRIGADAFARLQEAVENLLKVYAQAEGTEHLVLVPLAIEHLREVKAALDSEDAERGRKVPLKYAN